MALHRILRGMHHVTRQGMMRYAPLPLMLSVLFGCNRYDPDNYVFSPGSQTGVSRLFTLTARGDSVLPADGFSQATLVAKIHAGTGTPRKVRFKTTAGVFRVGAADYGDTATVATDRLGEAAIQLMSSRTICIARISAAVIDVFPELAQDMEIAFIPVSLDNVIAFVEAPDTALASNAEITSFTVRISPHLRGEDRKVTFSATQGQFYPGGAHAQTRTVMAEENNLATVALRSPENVSDGLITATVKGFTRETGIRFIPVPVERVIRLTEAPAVAPADGFFQSRFVATVSTELLGESAPMVTFETTHGNFLTSGSYTRKIQVIVDADHNAAALLVSPNRTAHALVTAAAKNYTQSHAIDFQWAPPDTILIDINNFQVSANSQTGVVAKLIRNGGQGFATVGTEVVFEAVDSLGVKLDEVRFFNINRSDENGAVSAVFTPDGVSYRGMARIIARLAGTNINVTGAAMLRIID